jgi:Peptidase A4 family
MKTQLAHCLCAAAILTALTSGPIAAQTADPPNADHSPMQPYRNPDGSIRRFHNSTVTGNWSGYAATASAPYSSASGTWQVPSVTYDGASTSASETAFLWVGIGGWADQTLIQLGSGSTVSSSGFASYNAWYELFPAGAGNIPYAVKPGDIMTASLQCTAACSPGSVQTWLLTMTDQTAGWTWTQSFQYQSGMGSAEWIIEAPSSGSGELPLADYSQATFDPVAANGANPNLSLSANGIIMQDPYGESSNPSDAVNGDVFSTCWGYGSLTPCTAGSFTSPPPFTTASLSASPTKISSGQSSTLSWSSTNATSCAGGGFTASGTSGSAVVSPSVTTSYSVTCNGLGGSATALATVTVGTASTCHGNAKKCN